MYLIELFERRLDEKIEVGDLRRKVYYATKKVVYDICSINPLPRNLGSFLRRINYRFGKKEENKDWENEVTLPLGQYSSHDLAKKEIDNAEYKEIVGKLHDALYPFLSEIIGQYRNVFTLDGFSTYKGYLLFKSNENRLTEGEVIFGKDGYICLVIKLDKDWFRTMSDRSILGGMGKIMFRDLIVRDIVQTYLHELIHVEQFFRGEGKFTRKEQIKVKPDAGDRKDYIEYVTRKVEIEARAHDIVEDLLVHFSKKEIKELLRTVEGIERLSKYSGLGTYYSDYLRYLHPNEARKRWMRLVKKILHFLDDHEKGTKAGKGL